MNAKLLLLLLTAALSIQELIAAPARPNILFIMSDDHAAHAISAYGSKITKTPNIDRLAAEGMRFQNCFAVNAICISRAAILTGKYSHINGVTVFNRFDGEQWTVAKELHKAGYHAGMVGKWHLTVDPPALTIGTSSPARESILTLISSTWANGDESTDTSPTSSRTWRSVLLTNRPSDHPFFLMVHHKATHRPWQPDEKHAAAFEKKDIPEPTTFNDDYSHRASAAAAATMRVDKDLNKTDLKRSHPGLSP